MSGLLGTRSSAMPNTRNRAKSFVDGGTDDSYAEQSKPGTALYDFLEKKKKREEERLKQTRGAGTPVSALNYGDTLG